MPSHIPTYHLIRSRRLSIALVITSEAYLEVRAPYHATVREIEAIIEKKQDWITKKIRIAEEKKQKYRLGPFTEGQPFLFMGAWYPLTLSPNQHHISIHDNRLVFPVRFFSDPERALMHWYAREAIRLITLRVEHFASLNGFSYSGITVTGARRRWGSCNHLNRLSFSWRLILTPEEVIDYVVVHELCHTVVKNHSKAFWNKVEALLPDYKKRQFILKQY